MSQPQQQQYSKQRLLQQQQHFHQQQQQQQQRWHYAHAANNDMNMFTGSGSSAAPSTSSGMFRGGAGIPGNGVGSGGSRRNMCNSNIGYDLEMGGCAPNAYYGNFQQNQLQRQQQQQHALQVSRRHQQQQQQQQQLALQQQFHYQQESQLQQRQLQLQPHIKSEPLDPMEQILTPTIEMEELIIKSEPQDEQAYNNYLKSTQQHQALPRVPSITLPSSASASLSSLPSTSSVNENLRQFCPEITIKEEFPRPVEQQQQKPLNFPRLKVQTERSGTLPICQRCKQVFLKKQSYIRHVAQSTCDIVEYDFKCDVCSMSFMSNEELMSHEQLHRLNKFFCHKYCGKYFDTIETCEMHEFQHHEYATFVCNICSATFPNRELLFSHMPQHRQQPRFDCPVCRLWFQTPLELHQHRIASPYFCGKYYESNSRNSEFRQPTMQGSSTPISSQRARFNSPDARSMGSSNNIVQGMPRRYFPPTAITSPNNRPHSQDRFSMNSMTGRNVNTNVPSSLPHIKTEIKTEPDLHFSQNQYSPHSSLHTPTQQRFMSDFTEDSFASGTSSQSFNNNFSDTSSNFGCSSRAEVIDDNEDSVCCVPKCGTRKSTSPSLQYFGFPRDEKYLHQWLHNLKMMHRQTDTNFDELRICSLHFPKRCINRYSLCYWAVPTFNLGHDDVANLYQNREITNCFTTGDNARCSMPGCSSQRGESNLKFYNFPKEVKMLIKWCQNARLPVHTKEPRHFCSRHFEDRCFGKFRLKPWAVPTLHLGTPYGRIHDNPSVLILEEKKCCLPHCKRSRSSDFNLSLYRFPRDETLLRRWCYNLRLDPDVYRGKNHKICSSHFIKEVLGLRKLSAGAVPTLNLGHNDTFNYYENELYSAPPPPPAKTYTFHNSSANNSGLSSLPHYASVSLSSSPTNFSSTSSEARPNSSSTNLMDFADLCCVPGCNSTRSTENITLHTIPRRPEQMLKWCHNLKMDPAQIHKGLRICNLHFEPYCIGGCMRPFAVPTLNLGHDDPNIHKNPDVIKKLNIRETCCVPQCKRNRDRDRANLHRFPSKPEMLAKWCANLNKPVPDGTRLFNDAICEIHFEERCLRNKRLEKWSIPTLNLGHDKIVHQLPSEAEVAELWARLNVATANTGDEEGECCVESCKRNPEIDDIRLYRMPDNPEVLAKWAHNLQMDVSDLPMLRICNLHFEPRCIGKRLYSWAIPTMNLGKNVEDPYQNPVQHVLVYKKEKPLTDIDKVIEYSDPIPKVPWAPRCCLPHCRNKRGVNNVQLFRIPHNNRSMLAKWCHNLQIPLTQTKPRRVCSMHFEPHVLTKRCPMPQAVPTLNLNTPPGYKIYQNPSRLKVVKVSVQTVCSVPSCKKTRGEGVQLFRLPHKGAQLRKWVHNLRLWEGHAPNITTRAQMRICSSHFEPHSFGAKRLVPGAIPTLNVGHDNLDDLYPNEAQPFSEIQCVVSGCNSIKDADNNVRLFKFPSEDEDLLWKWCNNLKMNPIDTSGVRICNRHFEEDCMGPKNLYKWAIPTIELGHNDSEIELIANPKPEDRYTEAIAKCCVPTCGKTRKYDDVQLNSFPKNPRGFRRWKHNLKLEHLDFKKRDQYKICNDHFEEICLGKNRLKYGAIPTLNLGHDETSDLYKVKAEDMHYILFGKMKPTEKVEGDNGDIDENESLETTGIGDTSACLESENKCNYPECAASKTVLRESYELPKLPEVLKVWCDQMNITPETLAGQSKLCGLHFIDLYEATRTLVDENEETKPVLEQLLHTYNRACNSLTIRSAQCSVTGCKTNQLSSQYRLYPFPYNRELIEKWTQNTGVEVDEHRRYLQKVCGLHFETYCLTDTQRLRPWAIPTLHLNRDESNTDLPELHQNPDLNSVERRMLGRITYKCCVADCGRERSDDSSVRLFNFPTDEKVLEKWAYNLQLPREKCPLYKICEAHFETYCLGQSRLRSWAVPTLKLGHNNEPKIDIYQNPKKVVEKLGRQENEEMDVSESEGSDNESLAVANVKIKKSVALLKCCVPSCRKSRLKHGVSLFPFPSNTVLYKKWCHNVQLTTAIVGKQSRVCNLHFHKRCIDGKQLLSWALPTLHLGHNESIYQNPKTNIVIGSGTNDITYCSLSHCSNYQNQNQNSQVRTVPFPTNKELLEKWCENLQIPISNECKERRICLEEHFEKSVFSKGQLMATAVPTLNLGHQDKVKYTNQDIKDETIAIDNNEQEFLLKEENQKDTRSAILIEGLEPVDALDVSESSYHDTDSVKQTVTPDKKWRMPNNVAPICCLKHCRKEKTAEQHLTTFGFPKDPNILAKWCDNLQLKPEECIGRVCIEHFELRVLGNRRLKPGAVPTLNLGHNNPLKHTNTTQTTEFTATTTTTKHEISSEGQKNEETTDSKNTNISSSMPMEFDESSEEEDYYAEKLDHSVFRLCCLKHCRRRRRRREKSTGTPSISLRTFGFPNDLDQRQMWAHNLRIPLASCSNENRRLCVCEAHFELDQFEGKELKRGALPTLDLGYDTNTEKINLFTSADIAFEEETKKPRVCCVPDCNQTETQFDSDHHFYSFPKRGAILRKWAYNTRQDAYTAQQEGYQICGKHFDAECFEDDGELKPGAVPTLELGHDSVDIYESELQEMKTLQSRSSAEQLQPLKVSCCIPNCGGLKGQYIVSHFPFPTDEEQLNKWCHNLRLKSDNCKGAFICSLHFKAGCIRKRILHKLAVPTENLGFETNKEQHSIQMVDDHGNISENHALEIYKNPPEVFENLNPVPVTRCCVRTCNKSRRIDGVRLYQFPKLRSQHLKWAHNLGFKLSSKVIQYCKVCELHFEPNCIRNKRLLPGSIPTLGLGLNESTEEALQQASFFYNNERQFDIDGKNRKRHGQIKASVKCAMRGCNLARSSAIALVSLPREDEELRNKWLTYIQDSGKSVVSPKLCALHFIQAYRALCVDDIQKIEQSHEITMPLDAKEKTTESNEEDMAFIEMDKKPELSMIKCTVEANEVDANTSPAEIERIKLRSRFLKLMNSNHLRQLMCAVPGCNITYTDNITFHQFPKDQSTFMKWQHNTQVIADNQRRYVHKICALHFEERCFGAKRVRGWAIPTLRLPPHNGIEIYENPKIVDITANGSIKTEENSIAQESVVATELCCVTNCNNILMNNVYRGNTSLARDERIEFWTLPVNDESMLEKWRHNLCINETRTRVLRRLRICSRHFEPYCFSEKYRLRHWAVPTLNLPDPPITSVEESSLKIYQNPADVVFYNMCCIPTCRQVRDRNAGIHLYGFPQCNEAYFEKWVHNVRLDPEFCRKSRICTLHFEKHMIKNRNLRRGALPTLDLGHSEEEIFHNPKKVKKRKIGINGNAKVDVEQKTLDENTNSKTVESTENNDKDESIATCSIEIDANRSNVSDPIVCCMTVCKVEIPEQDEVPKPRIFSFPKVDWLLKKWCENTRQKMEDGKKLMICERHFEPHAIGKSNPRPLAVPTLLLDNNEPIHENPKQLNKYHPEEKESGEVKFVRGNCCAIISCLNSKADGVQLYQYPRKKPFLRKWAENCRHHAYQAARYNFRICGIHFEEACFDANRRLRYGSVPTLNLGYEDEGPEVIAKLHCSEFQQFKRSKKTKKVIATTQSLCVMNKCGVPNCGRTKEDDDVRLYKFPDDTEILTKWCHNLNLEPNQCKNMVICNMHFEARCLNQRGIFKRAVPTLLLGHSNLGGADLIQNPIDFQRPETFIHCCVPGCGRTKLDPEITFSSFPKMRSLFEKWAHNLNMAPTNDLWHNYYKKVCNKHFENFCYEHKRLKFGSIPTLNLGHDNTSDIYRINPEDLTNKATKRGKRDSVAPVNVGSITTLVCSYPDCKELEKGRMRHVYDLAQSPAVLRAAWYESFFEALKARDIVLDDDEPKVCPVHFKLLYDEHILVINDLKKSNKLTEDERTSLKNLDEINAAVQQLSRVRSLLCSVPGCNSNAFQSVTGAPARLYSLPINRELAMKWCFNAYVSDEEEHRYLLKICGLHFEKECLLEASKRLRSWALPTLNLPNSEDRKIFLNPTANSFERSGKAVENLICCINSCPNAKETDEENKSKDDMRLFSFPREIPLMKKWLHNTGISKREVYKARICVLHFEKHCFNKRLRSWAIPTLNLDTERTDLFQNPKIKRLLRAENVQDKLTEIEDTSDIKTIDQDSLLDSVTESKEQLNDESSLSSKAIWPESSVADETLDMEPTDSKRPRLNKSIVESKGKIEVDYNLNVDFALQKERDLHRNLKAESDSLLNPYTKEDEKSFLNSTEIEMEQSSTPEFEGRFMKRLRLLYNNDMEDSITSSSIIEIKKEFDFEEDQTSMNDPYNSNDMQLVPMTEIKPKVKYTNIRKLISIKSALDCHVPNCNSSRKGGLNVTLHTFPLEPTLFSKWAHNCQLDPYSERRRHYRICNRHFEQKYYRNGLQLIHGTVPTLELGPNPPSTIYDNSEINVERITSKNISNKNSPQCCIAHSPKGGSGGKVNLFKFPESQEQIDKWVHNLGLTYDPKQPWKYLLCEEHFEKNAFETKNSTDVKLHKWAVPTLNLGDNAPLLLFTENFDYHEPKIEITKSEFEEDHEMIDDDRDDTENSLLDVIYKKDLTEERPTSSNSSTPSASAASSNRCCVPHCRSLRTRTIKLFGFPANYEMACEWQRILGLSLGERELRSQVICSQHFDPDLIGARNLIGKYVVPTLNLHPRTLQSSSEGKIVPKNMHSQPPRLRNSIQHIETSSSTIVRPEPYRPESSITKPTTQKYVECNVLNCRNTSQNVKIFSKFPSDFQLFTKWCFNLRIDPRTYVEGEFNVCSIHFVRSFLHDDGLDEMAVPTLYLGHWDEFYATTSTRLTKTQQLKIEAQQKIDHGQDLLNLYTCCVQRCAEKRDLYDFPRNPSLRLQWIHNLQVSMDANDNDSDKLKVCRKHFHKKCIRNDRLHPEAVPTLHLGYAVTNIYPNRGSYEDTSTQATKAGYSNVNTYCNEMMQNDMQDNDIVILDDDEDDDIDKIDNDEY